MSRFLLACVICLMNVFAVAQKRSVALTFDDLPLALAGSSDKFTPAQTLAETRLVNQAILQGLRHHHAPAVAFVNEMRVAANGYTKENRAILKNWLSQGKELGNHTYSHADLDKVTVEQFEKEIVDGESSISPLMSKKHKPARYFRFPFNHTGDSTEKHDAITAFLQQRGYQVAACTIDTSDWIFAHSYQLMLERKDATSAQRLRAEYLEFSRKEIEYYSQLSQKVFGREIPQIIVLHANGLNADTMEQILQIFEELNFKFISLEEAQSDPVYKTPDTYITEFGPMWGYRWARELNVKVNGRDEPEVPKWIEEYK